MWKIISDECRPVGGQRGSILTPLDHSLILVNTRAAWVRCICYNARGHFVLHSSSNTFKTMFLVGEGRYQSYVYFKALKGHFLAKIIFI